MARVLLVEDEKNLRELIAEALADSGHDPTVAENGVQALRQLEDGEYDVVISDISMPDGVSGFDVAEYIRAHNISCQVILVSGHARAQLPAMPEHATFLPKPYRIHQLLELVRAG